MIKNISAHISSMLALYVNRSRTFVQTINDKHFAIEIVYVGKRPVAPEYSFAAAGLIAASLASGHSGKYVVPCGDLDLWHVTITSFSQFPPIDNRPLHAEKGPDDDSENP